MNDENLIPITERPKSEQREIQRLGGVANGKKRRQKKLLRELLEMALSDVIENSSGERKTKKEVSMIQVANGMAKGDPEMLKLGAKILNEEVRKVEISGKDNEPIKIVIDQQMAESVEKLKDL